MEITMSDLRANLKAFCDRAASRREAIRIRRRRGGDLVLVAAAEYDSIAETAHLLASPKNAARLFAALARARRTKGKLQTVRDFYAALGG